MKRLCSLLIITVFIVGTVTAQARFDQQNEAGRPRDSGSAQNRENRQRESNSAQNRQRAPESVTVEGTLKLEKGFVALESGDTVYLVPMLLHYAGFIDGLKEGARVSVEGYQFRNMLHPKKVTINGKDYDFPAMGPNPNFANNGFGQRQGRNDFTPGRNNNFRQGQKYAPMNKNGGNRSGGNRSDGNRSGGNRSRR